MSTNKDQFDQAIEGIRGVAADGDAVAAAADRVWERLSRTTSDRGTTGCREHLDMMADYLGGTLSPSRSALFEDHLASCLSCRRGFKQAQAGDLPAAARTILPAKRARLARLPLLAAAVVVAAVGAGALLVASRSLLPDSSGRAVRVVTVEGQLLGVGVDGTTQALAVDQNVDGRAPLRTAKGSRAVVRLADGSRVEMRERSEISVSADRRGRTIDLSRGSVIVEAAPQHGRHLFVSTNDCLVSVTGTIFSVNHGTKGSRVSVVEGEVWVDAGNDPTALHPGDQVATRASVGTLPLDQELSWSANWERYRGVLLELSAVAQQVAASTHEQPLSPASRLLAVVPEDTVVYAAVPNVSDSMGKAHRLLMERIDESPVLRPWWHENVGPRADAIARSIAEIRDFGSFLGDEIVLTVGETGTPVILAEVRDPDGFRRHLEDRVARVTAADAGLQLRIVDDPATAPQASAPDELDLWVGRDVFAASFGAKALAPIAEVAQGAAAGRFAGSAFHARLAEAYGRGVNWFFAADLARIGQVLARDAASSEAWRQAGILDAESLLVETREIDGRVRSQAAVTFSSSRRGIASWLAAPAPMGTLDFVSPQARFAAAVVFKDPASMADDLVRVMVAADPHAATEIERLQSELQLRLRDDLAAPLGGELAVALDGPILPVPAWKVIVEVYDPVRLQSAIQSLVARMDQKQRAAGKAGLALESTSIGELTFHRIGPPNEDTGIHYVLVDGYALFAPQKALLEQAIRNRDAGHTLQSTRRFQSLLPKDGQINFSAMVYEDLGTLVAPIADRLRAADANGSLDAVLSKLPSEPTLGYAYGGDDRIIFTSDHGAFGPGVDLGAAGVLLGLMGGAG